MKELRYDEELRLFAHAFDEDGRFDAERVVGRVRQRIRLALGASPVRLALSLLHIAEVAASLSPRCNTKKNSVAHIFFEFSRDREHLGGSDAGPNAVS